MQEGGNYFATTRKNKWWHHNYDTKEVCDLQQSTIIHVIHNQWNATWFFLWMHTIWPRCWVHVMELMQGWAKGCMINMCHFLSLLEMLHLQLHKTSNNEFDSLCLIHLNVINVWGLNQSMQVNFFLLVLYNFIITFMLCFVCFFMAWCHLVSCLLFNHFKFTFTFLFLFFLSLFCWIFLGKDDV
jgi:hypothetical protein